MTAPTGNLLRQFFFAAALFAALGTMTFAQEEDTATSQSSQVSLDFLENGEVPNLEQLRAMEERIREISEIVKPATVNIQVGDAQGTGIIVSRDGYILTAAHVIVKPGKTANILMPDGTRKLAKTLGIDPRIDAGMLKLVDEEVFPYIDIGVSEGLNKGQWVMGIGHPGGWDEARGMVVRVGRIITNTKEVIRTDCVLVGGDSGGPLVDMDGNLIGIHSRISNQLWENLHVPVDTYSENWEELASGKILGREPKAHLGISLEGSTNEISEVEKDSPADEAGLEVGDIILKVGDKEIDSRLKFSREARKMKPDDEITLTIKRGEDELELKLTVGQQ